MSHSEPHGIPEVLGSVVRGSLLLGVLGALDGWAWGWALGKAMSIGLANGAIAGVLLGCYYGLLVGLQPTRAERRRRESRARVVLAPLVLIGVVGVIWGAVRQLVN